MSSDPIRQALGEIEEEPAGEEHGPAPFDGEEIEEEPAGEIEPEPEESGLSLSRWATRIPEGSHRDFDARDLWDPEGGGENRLAFHLADATGSDSIGYPNGLGVLVGFAELYYVRFWKGGSPEESGESVESSGEIDGKETLSREEAEALT